MLAILQAAVAGPVIERPHRAAPACGTTGPDGALIVCGAGQEQFRLRPLPETYVADVPAIPKAEATIAGVGRVALEAERAADAQGAPINRAMVRLKMPF